MIKVNKQLERVCSYFKYHPTQEEGVTDEWIDEDDNLPSPYESFVKAQPEYGIYDEGYFDCDSLMRLSYRKTGDDLLSYIKLELFTQQERLKKLILLSHPLKYLKLNLIVNYGCSREWLDKLDKVIDKYFQPTNRVNINFRYNPEGVEILALPTSAILWEGFGDLVDLISVTLTLDFYYQLLELKEYALIELERAFKQLGPIENRLLFLDRERNINYLPQIINVDRNFIKYAKHRMKAYNKLFYKVYFNE